MRRILTSIAALALSGCLFTADQVDPTEPLMLPDTPEHLFALLVQAYESRSVTKLDALLAPDYLFVADAGSLQSGADATWGRDQEKERTRRMFASISDVRMKVQFDPDAVPVAGLPASAPPESTWTAWDVRMEMIFQGVPWIVASTRTEFRLRKYLSPSGDSLYTITRWSDFN